MESYYVWLMEHARSQYVLNVHFLEFIFKQTEFIGQFRTEGKAGTQTDRSFRTNGSA